MSGAIGRRRRMLIEYDPTHDVLNIEFVAEEPIAESLELDGVIIDYTADRRIAAIEILDAGKRTSKNPLDLFDLRIVKDTAEESELSVDSPRSSPRCPLT
jgi:uncharacterized protein YuzE